MANIVLIASLCFIEGNFKRCLQYSREYLKIAVGYKLTFFDKQYLHVGWPDDKTSSLSKNLN